MMKRVFEKEAEYKGSAANAVKRFCAKHPEAKDFEEVYEWMAENGKETFNDTIMGDGSYNANWSYSLNLELIDGCGICKDAWYIAIILRDEVA